MHEPEMLRQDGSKLSRNTDRRQQELEKRGQPTDLGSCPEKYVCITASSGR